MLWYLLSILCAPQCTPGVPTGLPLQNSYLSYVKVCCLYRLSELRASERNAVVSMLMLMRMHMRMCMPNAEKKEKGKQKITSTSSKYASLQATEYHEQHQHRESGGHLSASSRAGLRREAACLSWFFITIAAVVRGGRF
jgi:hypothetical protein